MFPNPHDRLEPQWLAADVAEVLGWRAHEAGRCPRCGIHEHEWPAAESRDEDPPFFADLVRCPYCAMTDEANREIPDKPPSARDGVRVQLVPFDEDAIREAEAAAEFRRAQQTAARNAEEPGLL